MHDAAQRSRPRRVVRGVFSAIAFCCVTVGLVALAIAGTRPPPPGSSSLSPRLPDEQRAIADDRVHLAAARFRWAMDHACGVGESPAHDVTLSPFCIDAHEVTNAQFDRFVAETGYMTEAEQHGWGLVLSPTSGQWERTAGADWRHPRGPGEHRRRPRASPGRAGELARRSPHTRPGPADDCRPRPSGNTPLAAAWPTPTIPGGAAEQADGVYHANYYQGWLPDADTARDGHDGLAAVGSFAPASNGTHDMSGNAAEWCSDRYAADYYARSSHHDPTGPAEDTRGITPRHTIRGGSYLSPEGYCPAYRVTARASAHRQRAATIWFSLCVQDR